MKKDYSYTRELVLVVAISVVTGLALAWFLFNLFSPLSLKIGPSLIKWAVIVSGFVTAAVVVFLIASALCSGEWSVDFMDWYERRSKQCQARHIALRRPAA